MSRHQHRVPDAMHTGGRSKDDIDAGGVLPGYTGTIVRDGYAWLRPPDRRPSRLVRCPICSGILAAFHRVDPQVSVLGRGDGRPAHRRPPPRPGRPRGRPRQPHPPDVLIDIRRRHRGATAAGISDNTAQAGSLAPRRSPSRAGSAATKT
jgi:hypothetical protein